METLRQQGARLYHWGAESVISSKLENSSKIQSGALSSDHFKDVLDLNGMQGPAIYTSMDGWDSSGYGTHLMIIEVPSDASVVHWDLVN